MSRKIKRDGGDSSTERFLAQVTSKEMRERGEELCNLCPDVRVTRYFLGAWRFEEWLHSIGVCRDGELQTMVAPLPPAKLRELTGTGEIEEFLYTGLDDLRRFVDLYSRFEQAEPTTRVRVLDFGCGCGRLSRFWPRPTDSRWEAHASDVNPDMIAWCSANLPELQAKRNNPSPPLSYESSFFHFIFSFSVFTHLPASEINAWLGELHRVLARDGILIITIHGEGHLDALLDNPRMQGAFQTDRAGVLEWKRRLAREHFLFVPYPKAVQQMAAAGPEYGITYFDAKYIRDNWLGGRFKLLHREPGRYGRQDCIVLRKR